MPRRKRASKRVPTEEIVRLFLECDGTADHALLDAQPTYENAFLARAAWPRFRVAAWQHPTRGVAPPGGAVAYDGIGVALLGYRSPDRWSLEYRGATPFSLDEARDRLERDLATVEAFRRAHPAAAREIADELAGYVLDLEMIFSIVENEADPHEADEQRTFYEMRIRQQHKEGAR